MAFSIDDGFERHFHSENWENSIWFLFYTSPEITSGCAYREGHLQRKKKVYRH
jgi:hypothetical protein